MQKASKILLVFDVDGTLTPARKVITPVMKQALQNVMQRHDIAVVGGSNLPKQIEQVGEDLWREFHWSFPENGCQAYQKGVQFHNNEIQKTYTEEQLQEFINFCLTLLAQTKVPKKRGNFIEFRSSMINISPVGRSCSQEEREEFVVYDNEHKVRAKMLEVLESKFGESLNLKFSIGGQISIDVFPKGWDKTYCLQFVENKYDEIHFFGNMTMPGGNDYEIYNDKRVIGHSVETPEDTLKLLKELGFLVEQAKIQTNIQEPIKIIFSQSLIIT